MANLAYNRSTKRERETVNRFRVDGWISARSAGSKSKVDVWAYNPVTHELRMVQIKTKKGGRTMTEKRLFFHEDVKASFYWVEYK